MLVKALTIAISLSLIGFLYQFFSFIKTNKTFEKKNWRLNNLSIKTFSLNSILQTKLFKAGKIRWLMHFLVVSGFLYLVIFHALDDVTSSYWFQYYQPTVDPFQFLRNLAGTFVLVGCVGFLCRRLFFFKKIKKRKTHFKGLFSILLILSMILSGFLLEAVKIISEPVFMEMVEEYSDIDEGTDLVDLKIYWGKHYNAVFNEPLLITPEKLAIGKELNENFCIDCHSLIKSAFISKSIAKALKKTSVWLNDHRIDNLLTTVHYFLCLLIIVSLPFSRLFHIFLIPIASLEKNLKKEQLGQTQGYINTATLYACTNCGFCSDLCSVIPNYLITKNINTLPHAKIESFKKLMNSAPVESKALYMLQSGNGECTYCHKCTDICPSGIDLQNLWVLLNQNLSLKGFQDNYTFINNLSLEKWAKLAPEKEKVTSIQKKTTQLADNVDSFESCIQCTICTNVCPVVEYDLDGNDYTPQQVLNLLRLGKKHLATGTRMVWNCLTCFSCQESCPQGIKVADIMIELRNNGNLRADALKLENLTKAT